MIILCIDFYDVGIEVIFCHNDVIQNKSASLLLSYMLDPDDRVTCTFIKDSTRYICDSLNLFIVNQFFTTIIYQRRWIRIMIDVQTIHRFMTLSPNPISIDERMETINHQKFRQFCKKLIEWGFPSKEKTWRTVLRNVFRFMSKLEYQKKKSAGILENKIVQTCKWRKKKLIRSMYCATISLRITFLSMKYRWCKWYVPINRVTILHFTFDAIYLKKLLSVMSCKIDIKKNLAKKLLENNQSRQKSVRTQHFVSHSSHDDLRSLMFYFDS